MAEITGFLGFLLALGLGALIGAEREHFVVARRPFKGFGGIRTFTLISLLGAMSVYLSRLFLPWFVVPVLLAVTALLVTSYHASVQWSKGKELDLTGEVTALATFLIGMICTGPEPVYAVVLAIIVTTLLYARAYLHRFVRKLSAEEMYSALAFAIITFVILPFLPNRTYGPLDVLNPYKIWLMVVFISGMGFAGYILIKALGSRKGIGLTGLLGGLVSSTAVTLALASDSKKAKGESVTRMLVFATVVANAVMIVRVFIEVWVINKALLPELLLPLSILLLAATLSAGLLWWTRKSDPERRAEVSHTSPLSLGPAIKFGLLFGLVLLVAKAAQVYFGDTGVLVAGAVTGFVDVDAITLSMAQLAGTGVQAKAAVTAITLAVMSNTIVKYIYASIFGSKEFRNRLGAAFSIIVAAGIVALFL